MKAFKVFFYEGTEMPSGCKVSGGIGTVDDKQLRIESKERVVSVSVRALHRAEMYSRSGSMSVIRVVHDNGVLHVAVVRFLVAGRLALVNQVATHRFKNLIEAMIPPSKRLGI